MRVRECERVCESPSRRDCDVIRDNVSSFQDLATKLSTQIIMMVRPNCVGISLPILKETRFVRIRLRQHLERNSSAPEGGCNKWCFPPVNRLKGTWFRVQGTGLVVQGLCCRVQGPGSRVQGPGSRVHRVQGPGFRDWGFGVRYLGVEFGREPPVWERKAPGFGFRV